MDSADDMGMIGRIHAAYAAHMARLRSGSGAPTAMHARARGATCALVLPRLALLSLLRNSLDSSPRGWHALARLLRALAGLLSLAAARAGITLSKLHREGSWHRTRHARWKGRSARPPCAGLRPVRPHYVRPHYDAHQVPARELLLPRCPARLALGRLFPPPKYPCCPRSVAPPFLAPDERRAHCAHTPPKQTHRVTPHRVAWAGCVGASSRAQSAGAGGREQPLNTLQLDVRRVGGRTTPRHLPPVLYDGDCGGGGAVLSAADRSACTGTPTTTSGGSCRCCGLVGTNADDEAAPEVPGLPGCLSVSPISTALATPVRRTVLAEISANGSVTD
eukprot:scaffold9021_cov118-Isochrysis_galbana.AAC.8